MTIIAIRQTMLRAAGVLCGVIMLLFGFLVVTGGYRAVTQWRSIRTAYAAIAVLWLIAGLIMLAAALGLFISLGRDRIALWAGAASVAITGASLIAGVLTYVVPCAGPS